MTVDLDLRIQQKIDEIKVLADQLPGVLIIHNIKDGTVVYMSERGQKILNCTLEELKAMGTDYYPRFFNVEESVEYVPKMLEMVERNDPEEIFTFFQQVRVSEEHPWMWYLSSIKMFMEDEDGNPLLTITFTQNIDPLHHLTHKVQRLLDENNFLKQNISRFASLGPREKEVLGKLALGQSSGEIAADLSISVKTVETHRKNIKRKLNAGTSFELAQYARAFDLISIFYFLVVIRNFVVMNTWMEYAVA